MSEDQAVVDVSVINSFKPEDYFFVNVTPINCLTLGGGDNWACKITWGDGWKVEVNQGVEWDAAAKHFWNAVAKMVGQKAPFGW